MNMFQLIALPFSLVGLIMYIMVLVKLFQTAGPLQGILGIICGLWTFIWGWMNCAAGGFKNLMLIWTLCWLLSVGLNIVAAATAH